MPVVYFAIDSAIVKGFFRHFLFNKGHFILSTSVCMLSKLCPQSTLLISLDSVVLSVFVPDFATVIITSYKSPERLSTSSFYGGREGSINRTIL